MDSFWQRRKIGVWADHHPLVLITYQLFSRRYQRYLMIRFPLNMLSIAPAIHMFGDSHWFPLGLVDLYVRSIGPSSFIPFRTSRPCH